MAVVRVIVASGLSALPLSRGAAVGSARPGVEVGTRSGVSVVLASTMPGRNDQALYDTAMGGPDQPRRAGRTS